jgi:hypothetical protein
MGARRGGGGHWMFAVALGWMTLLIFAPSAFAAEGTGAISGTVTAAVSHENLQGIEVVAYEAGEELPVGFATTKADGEYTVEGLASGSYKVEFSAGFESALNYVTQYYEDASTLAAATSVPVTEGATTKGINAELRAGGEIEGTVTDASTHAAVSNAEVEVLGAGGATDGEALTNANGQYTIVGLATGSYVVRFASERYIAQYYDDQPSFATANAVEVTQESTTAAVDAALVPRAPVSIAAPVASGTPAVGQTLSCSTGSWTGTPTPTYAYAWLRDGVAIAGASGGTYAVQAADVGNGLTCKVTATNKNGSAAAVSNTLIVPVPPPPKPPTPAVKLTSAKIVVSRGAARVPISCASAGCVGTIELTERVAVLHRRGGRTIVKRETLVLGKGAYTLAAGHSATVAVRLTASVQSELARDKHHELSAEVLVSVSGGKTVSETALLSEAPPAKHRGKRK